MATNSLRYIGTRTGAWLVTTVLLGCGDAGPDLGAVTGTVTRSGKPVGNLVVNFQPETGRPSWGLTDAQGRFRLYYTREEDGARLGLHKVFVRFNDDQPQSVAGDGKVQEDKRFEATVDGESPPPPPVALSAEDCRSIIEKYGHPETTPLRLEVTKGRQSVNIKLD